MTKRKKLSSGAEPDHAWPLLHLGWSGPAPGCVDCVRVRLDDLPSRWLDRARRLLTAAELDKAGQIVAPEERLRVVTGRGAARLLLGRVMGLDPALVPIERTAQGKPVARGGPAFNVSHGGRIVLLALSGEFPVGVDVEPAASGAAWSEVAPRLHPAEYAAVRDAENPGEAFVRIWTRKEAVAKAFGFGFTIDPSLWAVAPGRSAAPPLVVPPPGAATAPPPPPVSPLPLSPPPLSLPPLSLHDLAVEPAHVAAVAVLGPARPRCWTFRLQAAELEPRLRRHIVAGMERT